MEQSKIFCLFSRGQREKEAEKAPFASLGKNKPAKGSIDKLEPQNATKQTEWRVLNEKEGRRKKEKRCGFVCWSKEKQRV